MKRSQKKPAKSSDREQPSEPTPETPAVVATSFKYLTVAQVASALVVSPKTIYDLCAAKKLKHNRIGLGRGKIRISEQVLKEFLERNEVKPRPLLTGGLAEFLAECDAPRKRPTDKPATPPNSSRSKGRK